jgi:predicted HTH domain antitoxin
MSVTVDDDVLRAAGLSDDEMRLEVAVLLFTKGLTAAQASRVAERPLYDFMQELTRRRINPHYNENDLDRDLEALDGVHNT